MARTARFLAVLLVGLGLLTWVAHLALTRTTRRWFERDVELRERLAVASARSSLVRQWANPAALPEVLADITRDERVMGAAACDRDGRTRAASEGFPEAFACRGVLAGLGARGLSPDARDGWSLDVDLPGGPVRAYGVALPELPGGGFVVIVHDMSFVGRREATTRNQLLLAFFVLALAAAAVTVVAARLAWRGWQDDLRRALRGDGGREFQPLMRDVRELVARLSQERDADARGGVWSPERLRGALTHHLQGERVVIVANREPYIHERKEDGTVRVVHPASGLVTALEPVMRACSGIWVAHGSGSADRETVDAHDRVKVPPGEESYVVRRVWLTEEEEAGYYYGFSNEGLWPLCHVAHTRPEFRDVDWEQYRKVNQRFADAVCDEVDSDDPIVLVQDYHFALAPAMIRARLPRATIITFWHIPWPNPERVGICPWRQELIEGLLGSSVVGFHTQQHCNNFLDAVDAFVESRIDREHNAVVQRARRTLVRPYPISIEWPVRWLDGLPSPAECAAGVRRELGLAPDALLGVGIDRLDYTKGIEERLAAVDTLLERHPELRGRFTFIQLAAPSRTRIARYQELNDRVEALADKINARWSEGSYRPVVLLRAHHEPPSVFRYFRAAELCYVSSLHDGMNLVAKEFVAARTDERGVLVLSQFTGAARELTEALVVNPYDLGEASEAMATALAMPVEQQQERMRAMRSLVAHFNVYRWAGRMLIDAAQLRSRERLSVRLSRREPGSRESVL
ncbi:MAG: trehalose-6-phosphate synthase [Deltaproteobacteria bacterium]|nr:trehalose-6-phosphate synthase [Myxococcales bacterium]MDP3219796.1 trehalose-6-phosphate synthase [Deltaproteobacteria bacterium]